MIVHGKTQEAILLPWRAGLARNAAWYGAATAGLVLLALWAMIRYRHEAGILDQLTEHATRLTAEVNQRQRAEADLDNILFDNIERQEADRTRIAKQLHDSLGQHVALLHLNVDASTREAASLDHIRAKMIQQKAIATEISEELSRIAWELRPVWLDDMGLELAIHSFIEVMRTRTDLAFNLDIALGNRRFSRPLNPPFIGRCKRLSPTSSSMPTPPAWTS